MLRIVSEWVSAHAKLEARITLRYVSACHKHTNIINTILSIDDNTLKGGKIHHYNDIHEIAKTPISPSPSSSSNGPVQNRYKYLRFCIKRLLIPVYSAVYMQQDRG